MIKTSIVCMMEFGIFSVCLMYKNAERKTRTRDRREEKVAPIPYNSSRQLRHP